MKYILWISVCFMSASALGATQNELNSMLAARSLADFDRRQLEITKLNRAKTACEAELKARAVPRDCFLELNIQKRGDGKADQKAFDRFSRICRENALKSHSRLDLSDDVSLIPENCRVAIEARLEDLRYADEDVHPELSANRTSGLNLE